MQNSAHSALRLGSPDQYNLADYMSHLAKTSFCNTNVPFHEGSPRTFMISVSGFLLEVGVWRFEACLSGGCSLAVFQNS